MEPWQFYLDEFKRRAERIPLGAPGSAELLAEVAHDAYQTTTDQLTAQGGDEEQALTVTRLFGQVVKTWIASGQTDWDVLRAELERRYRDWTEQRGEG